MGGLCFRRSEVGLSLQFPRVPPVPVPRHFPRRRAAVVRLVDRFRVSASAAQGAPGRLRMDNGPEFIANALRARRVGLLSVLSATRRRPAASQPGEIIALARRALHPTNFEGPHGGLDGENPYERLKQKTGQP